MPNPVKRLALTALLVLVAALPATANAGDTLRRVIDFKVLNVGMTADQPPMNTVNRSGNLMGFDVDLARAMAAAMNVKLEIKIMPFGELMAALERDEIDMIISGMAITPERTEKVSFVGPYMMSGKSLLTRDSVLARVSEAGEFNREDLKLLALKNSTSASFIREVAPQATLTEVSNYDEAIKRIIDGKADGLVADLPICVLSVLRYPDAGLVTLEQPLTLEPQGIAVSRDDPQFLNLVENYLDAYAKTGVLTKLRKKWLEDKTWIAQLP
jgi:ABC-type amino acid transport substrate-binding protein